MLRHGHSSDNDTLNARKRSTGEIVRRVAGYLRPYKLMAAGTIACAVFSLALSFVFPKATQFIIDEVIGENRPELLAPVIAALIGAFLLRDVFNSIRIRLNNSFEQAVIYDMRREVYGRLQRLPVNYFDQRASGDLMTRVIEDVNAVERLLIDGTEQGVVSVLGVVGVLTMLFTMNVQLTLIALIPIPLLAAGALWYTLTAHHRYRVQRRAASAMNALLMDNLQGVRAIKAFARESHEDDRFARKAADLREGTLVVMRAWANYSPAMAFCTALGSGLVLWIGGRLVIEGAMSLGDLIAFLFFLALFYEPIGRLHGLNQMLQSARAAGERVFDILDADTEKLDARRSATLSLPVRGEVRYDNVSFGYLAGAPNSNSAAKAGVPGLRAWADAVVAQAPPPVTIPPGAPARTHPSPGGQGAGLETGAPAQRLVLHSVSLHARPGDMIALVGPTGAGKSTLVNLLPAFYEPTGGRITIDGQDIAGVSLASLRDQISVVAQEPFLFNGTLRENILYGRLDATHDELIAAATAANCHAFISRLPDGYDSHVGERGVKLSVGEKQRVSIARALLKNAPLLILDEATASVDTQTERLIQEALDRLMAGRTSFVIAHRLSTIRHADQILVLRHGEIVERGSHEELVELDGLYARLARIQNTTFIEESFEKLEAQT